MGTGITYCGKRQKEVDSFNISKSHKNVYTFPDIIRGIYVYIKKENIQYGNVHSDTSLDVDTVMEMLMIDSICFYLYTNKKGINQVPMYARVYEVLRHHIILS